LKGTRVMLKTVLQASPKARLPLRFSPIFPRCLRKTSGPRSRLPPHPRPGRSASGRNTRQALRIKLEESLPERLVAAQSALGHDVDTVRAERLKGLPDAPVRARHSCWPAPRSTDTTESQRAVSTSRRCIPDGDRRGLDWMSCGRDRSKIRARHPVR
jgi:hypothetical protein